jgi:hypothetical protein
MATFKDMNPNKPGIQLTGNPGFNSKKPSVGTGQNPSAGNVPFTVEDLPQGVRDIGQQVFDGVSKGAKDLASAFRSANLPKNGGDGLQAEAAVFASSDVEEKDWRVSLSIPDNPPAFKMSPLLAPLMSTGSRMVFPYTPSIIIQHNSNYGSVSPVHNNYPFFAYQNSSVEALNITGQMYVQNALEAQYWVACVHYLRSITKMDYGRFAQGTPPPIVKLNGYGDYVFNNVPVVITTFSVDMPRDVDYIATNFATRGSTTNIGWAPAESQINVVAQPIYSRDSVAKFNYRDFVSGFNLGKGYI